MNDFTIRGEHWSFWVTGGVTLIWNLMGVINFFMQMNADAVATMPATHRAIIEGRALWVTGSFALAVFCGVGGCLLLLFRKSAAIYFFIASLAGVIAQLPHSLTIIGSTVNFKISDLLMIVLLPLAVATFLVWYSKREKTISV